ncbi:MAG: tyrosine-type recombinase/integrase, partial [Methylovulum sp.]|nr:tyrosine-type recombinase/integrase [Methylovulum sp.]
MDNPLVQEFTASTFAIYRTKRINEGRSPSTLNRELQTIKSMFTELNRIGSYDKNPLQHIRPVKHQQAQMAFLTEKQINQLMSKLKKTGCDAYLVALVCLSTGSRWGEAQKLKATDITGGMVHFYETKSKKPRSVP